MAQFNYNSLFAKQQPVRRPFGTGSSESESDQNIARLAQDWTVSPSTIYRWIASGKLPAKKLAPIDGGRKQYFLDSDARMVGQELVGKVIARRNRGVSYEVLASRAYYG